MTSAYLKQYDIARVVPFARYTFSLEIYQGPLKLIF